MKGQEPDHESESENEYTLITLTSCLTHGGSSSRIKLCVEPEC
jgi:hypothetical protein